MVKADGKKDHLAEEVAAAMDVRHIFDPDNEHANGIGRLATTGHDAKGHAVGIHYHVAQHLHTNMQHAAQSTIPGKTGLL